LISSNSRKGGRHYRPSFISCAPSFCLLAALVPCYSSMLYSSSSTSTALMACDKELPSHSGPEAVIGHHHDKGKLLESFCLGLFVGQVGCCHKAK
jgi:hypothetical protein